MPKLAWDTVFGRIIFYKNSRKKIWNYAKKLTWYIFFWQNNISQKIGEGR